MTIEEIKTNYAVEQGYYDWNDLINAFVMFNLEENDNGKSLKWFNNHLRVIDQLIQDELKNKCADRFNGGFERCRVIETEIL